MLTSMVQIFGAHSHWLAIIFAFKARVLYYFEPYGSMLSANDTIRKHFDNVLKPQGWRLTSLPLRLQTDGHSCGIWVMEVASVWLQYVEENPAQASCFASFLQTQLQHRAAAQDRAATPGGFECSPGPNPTVVMHTRWVRRQRL